MKDTRSAFYRWWGIPEIKDHTDYGCSECLIKDEDGNVSPGCDNCHEFDVEYALSKECELCVSMMDEKVAKGLLCREHPKAYFEPGYCEGGHHAS